MKATEILDAYMLQWNAKKGKSNMPYEIVMAEPLYKDLCRELKRNVKKYKGHKIVVL
jgi:hypothetical protein